MVKMRKVLLALSAVVTVGSANAALILDQSHTAGGGVVYPAIEDLGSYSQTAQQTFTFGLTGELTRIDLALGKRSEFGDVGTGTLAIKTLADVVLASLNFNVAALEEESSREEIPNSFTAFDLSAFDIFAAAGDMLKIVLSHDSPGWLTWDTSASRNGINDYAGGAATVFVFVSGVPSFSQPLPDFRFTTYVEVCEPFPGGGNTGGCFPGPGPFPAPEPTTYALMLAGLGAMGIAARRRNTSNR